MQLGEDGRTKWLYRIPNEIPRDLDKALSKEELLVIYFKQPDLPRDLLYG